MSKTWVGYITDPSYDFNNTRQPYGIPATYIMRRLEISSFKEAKIRIAALGVFSLYINGQLVNDDFMSGDCSEYAKVTYYRDYNIRRYLQPGLNTLGVILCDGWYASNLSQVGKNVFGPYPLKLFYEIYLDRKLAFTSDGEEWARDGEIRACDNQNGIIIDHNLAIKDFATNWCDLSNFRPVDVFNLDVNLKRSLIPPIKKHQIFFPFLISQAKNYMIYDFGQNFAGVTHLSVKGKKGTKITLSHAEALDKNGDIYTKNLRTAKAQGIYILNGQGTEEFFPRTVFYGFRYLKIEFDAEIDIVSLNAYAIYTACNRRGQIYTNNELVNQIYHNILWGQRSNFLSIPTDCPQRDERMGWTGDAQVFASTSLYNYDTSKFWKKYIIDIISSQSLYSDGVPVVCPYFMKRWGVVDCRQGWSDAIIIIPYYLYLFENDLSTLKRAFPYMEKYMRFVNKNHVKRGHFVGEAYGDWLSVFEVTDLSLYNDLFYLYDNLLMAKSASILKKKSALRYQKIFDESKKRFRKHYFKDGKLTSDTQGAYVLAYQFGLLSKEETRANLVRKIDEYGHLTTGFQSTRFLLPTLCELGEDKLAFQLLNHKDYPSWGYEIACGATTIWERWDTYHHEKGFNLDGMNSFNHFALGAVGHFLYATVMGISPTLDDPGFKTVLVEPVFNRSISQLNATLKTKSGDIEVDFVIENNLITYDIRADEKIKLQFAFKNKILHQERKELNRYIFTLKY